jgi:hypothetical protein
MNPSATFRPSTLGKWITASIWVIGMALQLTRSWQIAAFGLNTEIFMASVMGPIWAFLLVCLLAGFLRVFRSMAEKWSNPGRVAFALASTLVMALPQIDLIMLYRENYRFPPYYIDPMRSILLWATPLAFFLMPAIAIVWAWLLHNKRVSTMRALGIALMIFGIVYVPFGLLVNQLMRIYTQP